MSASSPLEQDARPASSGPVTIVVCLTCRDEACPPDSAPTPGERLAEAAEAAAPAAGIAVSRASCLGNCKRRLSAAMVRPGAWSYVFGDLTPADGADLVAGALLLAGSADGLMPWRGRPDSLKRGLVARIPPIDSAKGYD